MAGVSAVLCSTLRPGDLVVLPADGYYTARVLAEGYLTQMGVRVRLVATTDIEQGGAVDDAHLVWLESPSNPGLDVCDLRSVADAARRADALVAVDDTTATVLAQQPLASGADFSVSSDTKAVTGHADLLLGHVAVRDPELLGPLTAWRTQVGVVAGPFETWLAHRSLATPDVRLPRQAPARSGSPRPWRNTRPCGPAATRGCPAIPRTPRDASRCRSTALLSASRTARSSASCASTTRSPMAWATAAKTGGDQSWGTGPVVRQRTRR